MIRAILFDLDGTLLPMDQEKFTRYYLKLLAKKVAPLGYDPHEVAHVILKCSVAMTSNDGSRTNEEAFWDAFAKVYGQDSLKDIPVFQSFYENEFNQAREVCGFDGEVARVVARLKQAGVRLGIESNPMLPESGVEARIRWAGLDPNDFEFYMSYENCHYCKPNPGFLAEIVSTQSIDPRTCLVVGNDMGDDIEPAIANGLAAFLIVRDGDPEQDSKGVPSGDFRDLEKFLEEDGCL